MKKRYLVGIVICCLMIIPLVGCSKKDATTKVTVQTPLQVLTGRVNASDAVNTRQDQNITDLSNRITTEIAAVSHYNDAPIIARIGALEAFNLSNWNASLAYLGVRLASLESYNVSPRLLALENVSQWTNISARLRVIEVFLNISTNVSTPTPTPVGGNHAPVIYSSEHINGIYYDNFSESNYYARLFCNASDQDGDILNFTWLVVNTSYFINNGHSQVYWIPPTGWNGSLILVTVIIDDGKGGTVNSTRPITHY